MVQQGDTFTDVFHFRSLAASPAARCVLTAPGLDKALPAWWLTVSILTPHPFTVVVGG